MFAKYKTYFEIVNDANAALRETHTLLDQLAIQEVATANKILADTADLNSIMNGLTKITESFSS